MGWAGRGLGSFGFLVLVPFMGGGFQTFRGLAGWSSAEGVCLGMWFDAISPLCSFFVLRRDWCYETGALVSWDFSSRAVACCGRLVQRPFLSIPTCGAVINSVTRYFGL